ncbi:hypothetical protein [Gordonia caeni]|uniref:DNA ligase (ATP) n=1 Tax=Gordonia caeni TaxID=1007097 RepID=A0ABP7PT30_9ACTN
MRVTPGGQARAPVRRESTNPSNRFESADSFRLCRYARHGTSGRALRGRSSDKLVYLGEVGTGFTQQQRREIAVQLAAVTHPDHPFTTRHFPTRAEET